MPQDNEKDLPDIPENIRKTMKLHFVESMDEVLKIALEREMVALPMPAATPAVEVQPGGRDAGALRKWRAGAVPGSYRAGLLKAEFVVSAGQAGAVPLRPAAGDRVSGEK